MNKRLKNKNAIKIKLNIGYPLQNFVQKAWTSRITAKSLIPPTTYGFDHFNSLKAVTKLNK
jgi:hypothetical protein